MDHPVAYAAYLVNRLYRARLFISESVNDPGYRLVMIFAMAGCAYAFARGWINLHQILAVKPHADGSHELPWTREDIYR